MSTYQTYFLPNLVYAMFTQSYKLIERNMLTRYRDNLNKEWVSDVELESLIEIAEKFADLLKIDYTSYKNIEDLIDEEDAQSEDVKDEISQSESVSLEDMTQPILKTCGKCLLEFSQSSFSKDKTKKDGLSSTCKTCQKSNKLEYKDKEREKITEKLCKICNTVKTIENFSEHLYSKDGYVHTCHDCFRTINNEKRKNDREKGVLYKCGKCHKEYTRKDVLAKHLKDCR
jgi:hypothetical protein